MDEVLIGRFVKAFPRQFLVRLSERQLGIYNQSIAVACGESWTAAEAVSVLPTLRRAFWESEIRKTAIECGLRPFDMYHAGENCTCVMVKADVMILTAHFVDGPGQLVREAESRKQNAAINAWMDEHTDERLLLQPLPKLGTKPIYLNLLHGAYFTKTASGELVVEPTSCFLHVAIPEAGAKRYCYNWSAQKILLAYDSVTETAAAPTAIEDNAKPRAKQPRIFKVKEAGQE